MEETLTEARYLVQTTSLSEPRLHEAFNTFQPDALLVELGADILALQHVRRVLREDLKARPVPIIVLAQSRHLNPAQFIVAADDFILPPYSPEEIVARIKMKHCREHRGNGSYAGSERLHLLSVRYGSRTLAILEKSYPHFVETQVLV